MTNANEPHLGWTARALCAKPRNRDLGWLNDPHLVCLGDEATMAVICGRCPVLPDCEAYVDAAEITGGFWAGHHRTPHGPLLPVAGDAA